MTYNVGKWNLKDIINDKDIDDRLKKIELKVKNFESCKEKLKPDVDVKTINEMIELSEEIARLNVPLYIYAQLGNFADSSDEKFIALNNKIKQINSDNYNRTVFFSIWWKDLDDKNANRILSGLKKNKYSFEHARRLRKHMLKEEIEQIISTKDATGTSALVDLYGMMTGCLEFVWNGKKVTESNLMKYTKSTKAEERKKAYDVLLKKYEEYKTQLTHIYQNLLNNTMKEDELRKYDSPLSAKALNDDVPLEAINTLIKVSKENEKYFQEYFELKRTYLKLKKMNFSDIFAPAPVPKRKMTYDAAVKLVLGIFESFDSEFREYAAKIADEKHIDSELRPRKHTGGFCYSFPEFLPYILLHFRGEDEDIETLIHELGHGIHAQYSYHNTAAEWHAPICLCETASIFSEHLLFDKELREEKDKKKKIAKLIAIIDRLSGTIQKQIRYTAFEVEAHEKSKQGCSQEDIHQIWLKQMKESYGKSVVFPEYYKYGWMRISHFFQMPLYCYNYAFANLLVLALFKRYKKEGKAFVPKLKKILSYGGSKPTADVLKEVGIDITSEEFWNQGFDIVKEYISELKRLI
jgi:oligoendopeptidase F